MKKNIQIVAILLIITSLSSCGKLFGLYPKCKIPQCKTRMVHSHPRGDKFFRGMPICKKQNPLTGELWKKPKEVKERTL